MTVTAILDILLPYTHEENRCGFKKNKKTLERVVLAIKIDELKTLCLTDEEIIKQINDSRAATHNMD